ncbi:MAG: hypothetical protein ACO1O6_10260 [Bacteroidota bacterium]
MMRFLLIMLLVFLISCKKSEFQSCIGYDQLIGEWKSINSDTKNNIRFKKNGGITHQFGLERKIKYKATECVYEKDLESDSFYFFIRSSWGLTNYKINQTFDTLITNTGAQDIANDTTFLYKMKFVKV